MRRATRSYLLVRVVLTLAALVLPPALSLPDSCHSDRPIVTADFEIRCSKSGHTQVEVVCKTSAWFSFPRDRQLNLSIVKTVIFRDCNFTRGLSLLDITTSLNLSNIDALKFENSLSSLSREHLKGFQVTTLELVNDSVVDLPSDLLYDISLEEFFVDGMRIKAIPEDFFKNSSRLNYVIIGNTELASVKREDFSALENLKTLILNDNKIEDVDPRAFDKLVNLLTLDIGKNLLRTLPANVFKNLAKLEAVNLGQNEFVSLPVDLLRATENSTLEKFRLSHNRGQGQFETLPAGFFRDLRWLNYAELTSNGFTSLPEDLFRGAKLRSLNVSNNNLRDLPPRIFEDTKLEELWLSNNSLESLPEGLFDHEKLQTLFMDHNRLTNLTTDALRNLNKLETLVVSHNNLTYIDPEACLQFKYLKNVDLSHNQLTLANPNLGSVSSLMKCSRIEIIDLSYNKISQMFSDWRFLAQLRKLNLENNDITYITVNDFSALHNVILDLRSNKIATIDLADIEEKAEDFMRDNSANKQESAIEIYLDDNPLNCDCNLLQLLRYFEKKYAEDVYSYAKLLHHGRLRCASPPEFAGRSLSGVGSDELRCLVRSNSTNDACSGNCTCWDYPGKEVLAVDCSRRNLNGVPRNVVNSRNWSIELDLAGNRLRETPSMNSSYLLNVTALDLSGNNISSVSRSVFSRSLHALKLHDNKIQRLDDSVLEYLADDETLKNITLHRNRWICDCEARSFLGVVQKKLTTFELHEVTCSGTNKPLSNLTVNELCEGAIAVIVGICMMVALFGLVIGIVVAFYYKYQKEIKVWLYSKQLCLWFVTEDELDKDKQYDAFISFSHIDEDFVEKEIVAKLEDGPRPYKLCLHYRDWLAGEWIPAQIARSVEESRRTIVVLSPNFLESVWGRMEFRTAHSHALSEGRARVIVVLYGDIGSLDNLDQELKSYLKMYTYVEWGDPWFWDKLRYALPHRYEASKRRTRTARIMENHLAQLPPISNHNHHREENGVGKPEIIPMPKISAGSNNDSAKLLDSAADDERSGVAAC